MAGPMTSIAFDAILYGSPNTGASKSGGVLGMRRFMSRFAEDGSDNMLLPDYMDRLDAIGFHYLSQVQEQFAAKHGRTGETAQSMHSEFESFAENGVAGAFRYRIIIEGGVGFVVNPLPGHLIPGTNFQNPQTQHTGRQTNFYEPFFYMGNPKTGGILWGQGEAQSFSPDKSWYEDEIPELAALAMQDLKAVASRVALLWGQDGAEGEIPLTMPQQNYISLPGL